MIIVALACGIAGPAVFVSLFMIVGPLVADYDPMRHPVSSLSLSELGRLQVANFLITGALLLTFAVGLLPVWRQRGGKALPWVFGVIGIGLLGAGIFPADPIGGYPPDTPLVPVDRTTAGTLHDLFSSGLFFGIPVACTIVARNSARAGHRGWVAYSLLIAILFLVCFVLTSIGFALPQAVPIGGLLQRITLVIGLSWIAILATDLLQMVRHQDSNNR